MSSVIIDNVDKNDHRTAIRVTLYSKENGKTFEVTDFLFDFTSKNFHNKKSNRFTVYTVMGLASVKSIKLLNIYSDQSRCGIL